MKNEKYLSDFNDIDWSEHLDKTGAPNRGSLSDYKRFIWWVKKASDIFDNKFEYNFSTWVNGNSKTEVLCEKHGKYMVNARAHLSSKGCPKCVRNLPEDGSTVTYWKEKLYDFERNNPHVKIIWPDIDIYKGSTDISYICNIHGVNNTTIYSISQSKGCTRCSDIRSGKLRSNPLAKIKGFLTTKNFRIVEETYKNFSENATFICNEHNIEFISSVDNIYHGITKYGCTKCREQYKDTGKLLESDFRREFEQKLGERDIEILSFRKSSDITFKCTTCSTEWDGTKNHICVEGTGCPNCNIVGSTYLYLLEDKNIGIFKIGISRNPDSRVLRLNKFFDFEIVTTKKFDTRLEAYKMEQKLHTLYKKYNYKEFVDSSVDGKTELFIFTNDILAEIMDYYV